MLITSGSLTLTSSADGTPKTTYDLIPTSSLSLYNAPTIYESPYGQWFIDDLVYPSNNAGSGVNPAGTTNPSYITSAGLLFGQGSTNINIWTLGGANNYEIFKSVGTSDAIFGTAGGTFVLTPVPEPSGLAHLGLGVLCLAPGFALRGRTLALTAA